MSRLVVGSVTAVERSVWASVHEAVGRGATATSAARELGPDDPLLVAAGPRARAIGMHDWTVVMCPDGTLCDVLAERLVGRFDTGRRSCSLALS